MNITVKQITLCFVLLFLCVSCVGAIDISTGSATSDKSRVAISASSIVFEDTKTGLALTTTTKINGIDYIAPFTTPDNNKIIFFSGEIDEWGQSSPIMVSTYSYDGKSLKEVIVLKEDKVLSFPINISSNSKFIPWFNGQWKIVDKYSGNTMAGIILEKPYGIDALGNRIEMEYKYTKGILTLEYNRTIVTYDHPKETKDIFPNPEETKIVYSDITYPLTIDPTWTVVGDHYEYNISNTYIFMWNSTGTTNWTVPTGVSSIWILVVGAGGGGGSWVGAGGGGGGLINTTINVDDNTTYNITVGDGGAGGANLRIRGNNGGNSSFFNITFNKTSNGGGGGASYNLFDKNNLNGSDGGSGGGQTYAEAAYYHPGNGTAGQGYGGGWGSNVGTGAGGGGGSSELGTNGTDLVGGKGGNGSLINITNTPTYYAGGGGGAVGFGGTQSMGGLGGGGKGCHGDATNSTPGEDGLGGGGGYDAFATPWTAYGQDGGSGVVIISYYYFPPPIANFTVNNTTAFEGYYVQFNDTSTGPPTSWNWSFYGSGVNLSYNTTQNPVYMCPETGLITVNLTVTNTGGSNTTSKLNYLNCTKRIDKNFDMSMSPTTAELQNGTNQILTTMISKLDKNASYIEVKITWNASIINISNFRGNTTYFANTIINFTPFDDEAFEYNPAAGLAYFGVHRTSGEGFIAIPATKRPIVDMDVSYWNYSNTSSTAGPIYGEYYDATNGLPWYVDTYHNVTLTFNNTYSLAGVSNINGTITACGAIMWNWTDPADASLAHVLVWINNVYKGEVDPGVQHYDTIGLPFGTYTISTQTKNYFGYINTTWVNATVAGVIDCPPSSGGSGGVYGDTDILPIVFVIGALLIGLAVYFGGKND